MTALGQSAQARQNARRSPRGRTPGESEFSWGPGEAPPGLEDALPSQGGRYRGMAPPVDMSPAVAESAARLQRRQAEFDAQRAADLAAVAQAARGGGS